MEAIKLQSMTDFIESKKPVHAYLRNESFSAIQTHINETYDVIFKYCAFLKQPLQLGFFVPTDLENNILPEPQMRPERNSFDEEDVDYDAQELYEYIEAKKRVLFKGFEVKISKIHEDRYFIGWKIYNPSIFINIGNGWQKPEFPDFEIIEDLLSFSKEVELTDSAIKQIGI